MIHGYPSKIKACPRNSLVVQWLGLGAFTARAQGPGFDPWLGN